MFELIDAILEKVLWKWGQTVASGGKWWQTVASGTGVGGGGGAAGGGDKGRGSRDILFDSMV